MLRELLRRWQDWTGDKRLDQAIRRQLRAEGLAASSARIRDVRLEAIQRPGWVQVYRFAVETHAVGDGSSDDRREVVLLGLSRDDGREASIRVFLTEDEAAWRTRVEEWSDGLIRRRR